MSALVKVKISGSCALQATAEDADATWPTSKVWAAKCGVRYINYQADDANAKVSCLVDAPDPEMAMTVHREAHGLVAHEICPVVQG